MRVWWRVISQCIIRVWVERTWDSTAWIKKGHIVWIDNIHSWQCHFLTFLCVHLFQCYVFCYIPVAIQCNVNITQYNYAYEGGRPLLWYTYKLYLQSKRRARDSDMALLGHHPSKPLDLNTALVILSHDAVLEKCSMRYHLWKTWLFVWWAESKKEWTEYFINKALYKKKKSNLRHWRPSDAALSSYLKAC